MAIAAAGGGSANNSGSVSSLALPSYTTTTGRDVIFAIVLGSTSSSVSSISNSAGSYTSVTQQAAINGTGVRVEIWSAHVATGAATVFTVNITGGATSISAGFEEYSGVSAIGATGTSSGSGVNMQGSATTTQGNDWTISAFGFACQSGDTLTGLIGSGRQSSIPAATAVAAALYDDTMIVDGTIVNMTRISNSRQWASATLELKSGGAAMTAADYGGALVASLQADRDVRYLHCLEPLFAQTQTYPPTPGANNYGFVG